MDVVKVEVQQGEHSGPLHEETRLVSGSTALAAAKLQEPPKLFSKNMLQLYLICVIAFCGSTMNGFDGSLMGSLLVMKPYQEQFGAAIVGVKAGYISAMMQIGGVCAIPFSGPTADMFGRRVGIFTGVSLIIMGVIIQGTSNHLGQYLAGRFFLGFGNTITSISEMAHPAYRGVITGLYNSMYSVGQLTAGITVRFTDLYSDNRAWLIPTWVQMCWPGILWLCVLWLPESPRWLYAHGKPQKAAAVLAKYHGNGDPDSVYVSLQMSEFERELELQGADKRWWDYRVLFNSHKACFRTMCACSVPVTAAVSGNGMVGYFLPAMLSTAGVTNSLTVLDYNLAQSVLGGFFGILGASVVERFGRRRVVITGLLGMVVCWACLSAGTAEFSENDQNVAAAKASITFIMMISVVFPFGFTALQNLYPVECFAYEQRAKGMAFQLFALSCAGLIIQFATPVAIGKIGWRLYPVFVGWNIVEAVFLYFVMVETKGRTLEEVNEIFDAPHPRKYSLQKKTLVVDPVSSKEDEPAST